MTGARRTRRWWPSWGIALTAASLYFGAVVQALSVLQHQRPWNWAGMIAAGVVFAVAVAILRRVQQGGFFAPSNDDRQRRRAENAVVTAGALPPDADPHEWSIRLGRMRDVLRQNRWSTAGLCVVIGGLVGAAAAEADGNPVALWALAIGLTAFAVVPFWWFSRRLRATERVLGLARGSL